MATFDKDKREKDLIDIRQYADERKELDNASSDEELGVGDYLVDMAAAIPRGIESGVKDIYNLVDDTTSWAAQKITGDEEADILPDYEDNFLGESKTGAGKVIQGITEWASVFIPVGMPLKAVAKGATLFSKAGKAGKVVEKAAKITTKYGIGTGAIADMVVQQQNEGTLSNMLQDAGFDNALTNFMATEKDDSTLEVKLKAALEGALLGGAIAGASEKLISPIIKSLKKSKAIRSAVNGDMEKTQLEALINEKVLDDDEIKHINEFMEARELSEKNAEKLLKNTQIKETTEIMEDFKYSINSDDIPEIAKANYKNIVKVNSKLTDTFVALKDNEAYDHKGFLGLLDNLVELREVTSLQGKSLQALKGQARTAKNLAIKDTKSLLTLKKTVEGIKNKAPEELKELNEFVLGLDSPRELRDFLNQTLSKTPDSMLRKAGMMTQEFWRNALLSGTATHVLNAGSNAFRLSYEKFKTVLTGAFKNDPMMMKQGAIEFRAMFTNALESGRLAFKAARNNFARSRPQGIIDDSSAAFIHTAKNEKYLRKWSKAYVGDNAFGAAAEYIGNVVNIPTTMLSATDEMFKQLAVRSKLEGKFFLEGSEKGLKNADLEVFIKSQVDKAMLDSGEIASREALFKRGLAEAQSKGIKTTKGRMEFANKYAASTDTVITDQAKGDLIEYARKLTYQTELKGVVGTSLNKMANEKPLLFGWFLPFIKTPMNVLNAGIKEFTPLRSVYDAARGALFSSDASIRAEAQARFAVSMSVTGAVLGMVNNGAVTGSGPKDPNIRANLMASGWQPYSIKFGDKYISYRRLDPLATPLGLVADMFERYNEGLVEDADSAQLINSLGVSVMHNLANKSYFQGITGVVRLLTSIENESSSAKFFASQFLGSFVPAIVANSNGMITGEDPVVQVRGVFDSMQARLGFDEGLEKKRNLLGEEINALDEMSAFYKGTIPAKITKNTKDSVSKEMADVGLSMGQPSVKMNGVDLREEKVNDKQSAYSRYLDLIRDTKINGKNLRSALKRVISSSRYQKLEAEAGLEGQESARATMLRTVISRYRTKAKRKLVGELDGLRNKIALKKDLRRQVRQGKTSVRTAVERLMNTK